LNKELSYYNYLNKVEVYDGLRMQKSRLEWAVQRRIIEHFVSGSTARTAASLVSVNKITAALYFHHLDEKMAQESADASPLFGENFWNQVKRPLRRFNGVPAAHFHLFLKECECLSTHLNQNTNKPNRFNGLPLISSSYPGKPRNCIAIPCPIIARTLCAE